MTEIERRVREAAGGDHDAFAHVVRAYQSMVFSLALHFLNDRSVAEETAQEVFLSLYRNLDSIRSEAHLQHWLRKVTGHRCIDTLRTNKDQVARDGDWQQAEAASVDPDPSDPILAGRLRRLVASLPEVPRLVLIMRYQEDLAPSEIATQLEMPVNTVKSHLHRSLALLRQKLGWDSERQKYEPYRG